MEKTLAFCLVLCFASVFAYEGPAETYGAPFETYGPPQERTLEENIILPPPAEKELLEEVRAPPNTRVDIRDEKNQYSVGFQEPSGTEVKEQGRLISTDNGWEYVIAKTGSYKYISPEGISVNVNWVADENGFRILDNVEE